MIYLTRTSSLISKSVKVVEMPEGSIDATNLIAARWQALKRAKGGDERTMITNCTIIIVLASFFTEANLNHIINEIKKDGDLHSFMGRHPGLQDKLAWFYNNDVAKSKADNKRQLFNNGIVKKLKRIFPGYDKIYQFRNNISHSVIDRSIANLEDAKNFECKLRLLLMNYIRSHPEQVILNQEQLHMKLQSPQNKRCNFRFAFSPQYTRIQ